MKYLLTALALCLLPIQAPAQSPADAAAQNMQLAAELCLRNYRTPGDLVTAFQTAGYTVGPYLSDAGVFEAEAPGLYAIFDTDPTRPACTVQSGLVPLPLAEAIGRALGNRLFPGQVQEGRPEHVAGTPLAPCEGFQVFAPQRLIAVSFAAAGNSGDCIQDGTSSILIQM